MAITVGKTAQKKSNCFSNEIVDAGVALVGLLNNKQQKIYDEIWLDPSSKKLKFDDVSKLLTSLGCECHRRGGANTTFRYAEEVWGMHPPHPQPYVKRPYIKLLRKFLIDSELKTFVETGE